VAEAIIANLIFLFSTIYKCKKCVGENNEKIVDTEFSGGCLEFLRGYSEF
jgi:hypothetical protein